jgi:hypothetical protein
MIPDEVEKVIKEHDQMEEINRLYNIPQCCREGWEDCPHVINREQPKTKRNIGM